MTFSLEALQVLSVITFCLGLLIFSRLPADVILTCSVGLLLLLGVLTPEEALSGLSNEGMATVAVLFIVARALSQTGVVDWLSKNILGRPKSIASAQLRLMLPVAGFSSILNNTPVVAMMVPTISNWAKRNQLSVSKLMIPLSYAAIIGGTCTLVGTSTNLVINGMLQEVVGDHSLAMFDLARIGVPCTIIVLLFIMAFSRWLLPLRNTNQERFEDARQYIVEMEIETDSPLAGQSIEAAGLRQLPGMYLIEINRQGQLLSAVAPETVLQSGDHLIFAGDVTSVVDLKNIHGIKIADHQVFKIEGNNSERCLVEVVISPTFPFLRRSIRDAHFRSHFNAAIIAVARDSERITSKIGDIILNPGDTLLLETHRRFIKQHRYSKNFLLVSEVENSSPVLHEQRNIALAILLGMIALVTLGLLSMLKAAFLAAVLMILTRCIRISDARQSVDVSVILIIASSIALGVAMDKTGAATVIAETLVSSTASSPIATLAALFFMTAAFSAVISNLAAAVLLFPVAVAASESLQVDLLPFAVTLMLAASASFSTPIGYQTNLMVYGPGNYRFTDFIKIGLPLTILVGLVCIALIPQIWPF